MESAKAIIETLHAKFSPGILKVDHSSDMPVVTVESSIIHDLQVLERGAGHGIFFPDHAVRHSLPG